MESFVGKEGGYTCSTSGGVVVREFCNRQPSNLVVLYIEVVGP